MALRIQLCDERQHQLLQLLDRHPDAARSGRGTSRNSLLHLEQRRQRVRRWPYGDGAPVQGLLLTPLTQDFGTINVGSSTPPVTFTLANLVGSAALANIQSVTTTGDFIVATNTTGGPSCSGALASTAACYINVIFAPTALGQRTGTLTVTTDQGAVTAALAGYASASAGVSVTPSSLNFDNIPGSAATQQTLTLSNTGQTSVLIGTPSSSSSAFAISTLCNSLAAGSLCTMSVTFTPQAGPTSGTLTIPVTTTANGQTLTSNLYVALNGDYAAVTAGLRILPDVSNFGAQATSTLGLTRQFTVMNFSPKALALHLTMPQQFPLSTASNCATLAPSSSCVFSASFLPNVTGEATGSIYVDGVPTDGTATLEALSYLIGYGNGSGSLQISGSTLIPTVGLSFGQLSSGQSAQQAITLTNVGSASVAIHHISSEPPFFSTTTCGATLATNASCNVSINYAPTYSSSSGTAALPQTATLTVDSDAASSPNTLNMTGTVLPTTSAGSTAVLSTYSLSQGALTFSNTTVGNISPVQTITLTNTGNMTLHLSQILTPADFQSTSTCSTVLAGASCNINVSFAPTTASTSTIRSGALQIASDSTNSLQYVTLVGTSSAAPLTLSPTVLDFGAVNVNGASTLNVIATNTAATPVVFNNVTVSGDYTTARGTCPLNGDSLAAGSNCALTVTFKPTAVGTHTGALQLATNATQQALTVSLTGIGVSGQLLASPSALSFGNILVGVTSQLTLTLTNSGQASVTGIRSAMIGSNAADFTVVSPCSVTALAPNQGCTLVVAFTPSAAIAESATLSLASSDPNTPLTIPLTGTGFAGSGSFTLTATGGLSTAAATVKTGFPAAYGLTLTPSGGYAGEVTLTCTALVAVPYAGCSLVPSRVTLNGPTAQSITANITTVTSMATRKLALTSFFTLLIASTFAVRRRRVPWLVCCVLLTALTVTNGCGGGASGNPNLRYTPAGTYQYQITASSTNGSNVSSTVTLSLTVQ
ncbi:beta strand repeat-containing protein [Granulicella cerasi]|uniref:Beta strand repeat-containing protein n=1 Tax=Granulicella cerasi TaxID=741063 RepID=A0ABW1Z6R6_9BACT